MTTDMKTIIIIMTADWLALSDIFVSMWNHFYNPRANMFSRICLSCSGRNCWKPRPRNFVFGKQVYLLNIYGKVEYLGQLHANVIKYTRVVLFPLKGNAILYLVIISECITLVLSSIC